MNTPITVITGTTHGIGTVTARELARAGHRVLMLVRDPLAGEQVKAQIQAQIQGAQLEVVRCDLASLESVRAAAVQVQQLTGRIDCLINNAGIASMKAELSADGYEKVFATNHLGPFLLTELLRPGLQAGARIVNVASCAHLKGTLDLGQVSQPFKVRFRPQAVYAQSKLANVMHTFALARRLAASGIAVNCLHPGVVRTNLLPRWVRVIKPLISHHMIDAERGAQTSLYLALDPAASDLQGCYLDEFQQVQTASPIALDVALQEALWTASQRWVAPAHTT
jgi:NAD(P)-dependent dehydrogenase (short-subunit alcohol dehydrogenase family)